MSITIRHFEGPLSGQLQLFDDSFREILFGRSPNADVVYPPECEIIANEHFKLRKTKFGHYSVESLGPYYVEVEGAPISNGMMLKSGSTLRLGNPKGPSFQVVITQLVQEPLRVPSGPGASAVRPQFQRPSGGSRGPMASAERALQPTMDEIRVNPSDHLRR